MTLHPAALATKWFGKMAPRNLAWIFGVLFLINVIVPDPIPLIDELLFGVLTIMFATWRAGRGGADGTGQAGSGDKPPMKNVTPPGGRPGNSE